jgi:hypothetical protein
MAILKIYHRWSGLTTNIYFSQFWRLGSLRARYSPIQCLAKTLLLVCRWLVSGFIFTWPKTNHFSCNSFYENTNPNLHDLITFQWPYFIITVLVLSGERGKAILEAETGLPPDAESAGALILDL